MTRRPAKLDERGRPIPEEEPAAEPFVDEPARPGAPDPVLLELAAHAGVSLRADDGAFYSMPQRAGFAVGGSAFVWTGRWLAFGVDYMHADLDRVESPAGSPSIVSMDHDAHTLLAEAKVIPLRFSSTSIFLTIGGGLAWQAVSTRASLPPLGGSQGGSFTCRASGGAEFAFRVGLGVKARLTRAASLLVSGDFVGYRLSGDLLDDCGFGASTAQTVMIRAGIAYDLDISRLVR